METLRKGAMGSGLLVSASDRGFFDTFKEAGALAKHVSAARSSSESAVVKKVAESHGTGFGVTTPAAEVESGTLEALRASVALLQAKAPDELRPTARSCSRSRARSQRPRRAATRPRPARSRRSSRRSPAPTPRPEQCSAPLEGEETGAAALVGAAHQAAARPAAVPVPREKRP